MQVVCNYEYTLDHAFNFAEVSDSFLSENVISWDRYGLSDLTVYITQIAIHEGKLLKGPRNVSTNNIQI